MSRDINLEPDTNWKTAITQKLYKAIDQHYTWHSRHLPVSFNSVKREGHSVMERQPFWHLLLEYTVRVRATLRFTVMHVYIVYIIYICFILNYIYIILFVYILFSKINFKDNYNGKNFFYQNDLWVLCHATAEIWMWVLDNIKTNRKRTTNNWNVNSMEHDEGQATQLMIYFF